MLQGSSKGASVMSKHRGGGGDRPKRTAKEVAALVETLGKPPLRLSLPIIRKRQPAISVEKLRALRYFSPSRIKPALSKLLIVGEGRSQFSLLACDE
jgi:hypothetical protein